MLSLSPVLCLARGVKLRGRSRDVAAQLGRHRVGSGAQGTRLMLVAAA